ncbi:hypothetical protein PCANC_00980 [Puccinia coronata f. sp. avenae]|uniref:Uncharacterized protein n=1 Tax=Puccinia coronata f. sp. avenae TaxID=200324 RepID=A0A2N5T7U6_9BASI|nr:hypothetical protein PCANC_04002 [Puccinia coronata f. sp. avenae]PLW49841.1 hypothetical protein PCASD_01581 [Puccinia coronata f. sp. avenae]PLW57858.1 hypothetical protein PCANC_00980 [Puccinia coronata f. sp. avenae]
MGQSDSSLGAEKELAKKSRRRSLGRRAPTSRRIDAPVSESLENPLLPCRSQLGTGSQYLPAWKGQLGKLISVHDN